MSTLEWLAPPSVTPQSNHSLLPTSPTGQAINW